MLTRLTQCGTNFSSTLMEDLSMKETTMSLHSVQLIVKTDKLLDNQSQLLYNNNGTFAM